MHKGPTQLTCYFLSSHLHETIPQSIVRLLLIPGSRSFPQPSHEHFSGKGGCVILVSFGKLFHTNCCSVNSLLSRFVIFVFVFLFCSDGSLVADQVSFELVKSLELLCCVLGWQWAMNDLIIDNIWRILDTWTGLADSGDVDCLTKMAPLVTASTDKQNGIVKKDGDIFARAISTCRCQTSNDENVCTELPSLEVINGMETKENNQVDVGEECEVCRKCRQLKKHRLVESQIVICIQLLGRFLLSLKLSQLF